MVDHLQQLLCEHSDLFFDLVANQVWRAEETRASKTNLALDVDAAIAWRGMVGHARCVTIILRK